MKPLLVGELNPYGADPEMALYPLPPHAAGGRLARILGLSRSRYLRTFDRMNLCVGRWRMPDAKKKADEIIHARQVLILLGAKVSGALGFEYRPFTRWGHRGPCAVFIIPHPSGRNRAWNEPGARDRVRAFLADFLPDKPDKYEPCEPSCEGHSHVGPCRMEGNSE